VKAVALIGLRSHWCGIAIDGGLTGDDAATRRMPTASVKIEQML
jgi:hypothetical protein